MKEERHQKIIERLSDGKYASVEQLSRELHVSMPTIRRDLAVLQEKGYVVRSHGGVIQRLNADEPPLIFRSGVNMGDKLRLAKAASRLMQDDMVIFLDESSTTMSIVEHMGSLNNIRVITNSMAVLHRLSKTDIRTYCLGGEYAKDTMAFYGSGTEKMLTSFGIDIMFFSSSGLNGNGWIVDYSEPASSLRRCALEQSEKKVFLCDKSKYGARGAYALTRFDKLDYAFLTAPLPAGIDPGNVKTELV